MDVNFNLKMSKRQVRSMVYDISKILTLIIVQDLSETTGTDRLVAGSTLPDIDAELPTAINTRRASMVKLATAQGIYATRAAGLEMIASVFGSPTG